MTRFSRRRVLLIGASAAVAPVFGSASRVMAAHWHGAALGARAQVVLRHLDATEAEPLFGEIEAELARLESIFSLYRHDSALSTLNAQGRLAAPPPELLELLGLSRAIHAETDGLFDPSVQPLFDCHARASASGEPPAPDALADALGRIGFGSVRFDAAQVSFSRPGMALTLNGIAQGYVTDRIAALLKRRGLHDVLVDIGEIAAIGHGTAGEGWRVRVANGGPVISLSDQAVATSMPRGTILDPDGRVGHIFDPDEGWVDPRRNQVTVVADSATLADALSTAASLMSAPQIDALSARVQILS